MKQIRFIAVIAAAAALTAACAKEMNSPQGQSVSQITASWAESQTKTVLGEDGTSILWSPNDVISVFYDGDGMKFTGINSTPKAKTIFLSSGMFLYGGTESAGSEKEYLYGIYPYSRSNAQDGEYLTLTVPDTQPAVEGSFARGAFPSVGRSKDTNIAFYNVCGGIRFSVTTPGVHKVVFSGLDSEDLAGKIKVVFGQDGKPVITTVSEGDKELTICIGKEFTPGKYYYISAIPTVLKNGFKMVFYTISKHATLTSSSAVEIKRSTFGTLKEADTGLIYEDGGYMDSIDLGLSVKWATCNVGASSPMECGSYFAWGDVTGQTWDGSSWSGGGFSTYPAYELDKDKNLKLEYDAAHVNLGGSWRMPTKAEQEELINNCTSTWTSDYNGTGVAGRIFTSKKVGYTDKSIFLPAAGCGSSSLNSAGSSGNYWSSAFYSYNYDLYAWNLRFSSGGVCTDDDNRSCGQSVRPVTE